MASRNRRQPSGRSGKGQETAMQRKALFGYFYPIALNDAIG
jgi:hypothetical protein